MEIYCEEERDKPPRYLGEVAPGITLEGYCGFLSQLTVYDKESGEIQQKFEIFSDGMHFIVIPQPKPVATQMLLKNYTDLYRESYKKVIV